MPLPVEMKIQPSLNATLLPMHVRGASGLMSSLIQGNSATPSQDSSATGSPNSGGGNGAGIGGGGGNGSGGSGVGVAGAEGSSGHVLPPPDVCSTAAEAVGAVGSA